MIPNAVIASPCAYSLSPGFVITGTTFVGSGSGGSDGAGGSGAGAAVTVTVKSRVTSAFTPSFAVTVTV